MLVLQPGFFLLHRPVSYLSGVYRLLGTDQVHRCEVYLTSEGVFLVLAFKVCDLAIVPLRLARISRVVSFSLRIGVRDCRLTSRPYRGAPRQCS